MSFTQGYDCTQDGVSHLPTDGDWYAGYAPEAGQHFVSYPAIIARFPHSIVFAYTLGGRIPRGALPHCPLLVLDYENGNPDPDPHTWVQQQLAEGWKLNELGVYADLSHWNSGLKSPAGVKRVLALYNGVRNVPSGFDCHQYSDKGGGGAYDLNVALPSFIHTAPPPTPPDVANAALTATINPKGAHWQIHGVAGSFKLEHPGRKLGFSGHINTENGHWDIQGDPVNG